RDVALVTVGRKGRDFFRRRGVKPILEVVGLGEDPDLAAARSLAAALRGYFQSGQMSEVFLVYTEFVSALRQQPVVVRLLPLTSPQSQKTSGTGGDPRAELLGYIYEPSSQEVLKALLPRFVDVLVFRALLEAKASEHGARMRAMGSATENAGELIHELTLEHNRARQAGITREISEIVGGAEALK
ncbi:MAG: F0F1 ATP synthase subunit gamma, partial [Firmicutes bacterium]|nr:F0F1 ATP synthase subunit gamma [Bacillota bacterium]